MDTNSTMRIHLISIGGAVMHNLALELQAVGHKITGSDDEIYNPSYDRLDKAGLLPQQMGWDASRITQDIDLILLGMHARPDNPELQRAQKLKLEIQSFPEFIGQHAKGKIQIVVAGSHGKTTTTSMIMHALKENEVEFDYLVGAQLEGFERMVRLSDAEIIVIEGDEYLSSPIDRQPKFLHYDPDYLILTGVQWDHMNVFPTMDSYVASFMTLLDQLKSECHVFYDETDDNLSQIIEEKSWPFFKEGYKEIPYQIKNGKFNIRGQERALGIMGSHNMKNISAAVYVLSKLNLEHEVIYDAMASFAGAAKRQDIVLDTDDLVIYRDFAHAPSKVRATLKGIRELYPDRYVIAACELHTFSSLNKAFLPQYSGAMTSADSAVVFYSPHTLEIKKMPALDFDYIKKCFERADLNIFTESEDLHEFLIAEKQRVPCVFLLMSSGTFGGLNLDRLIS